MSFVQRNGWACGFLEPDCKMPVYRMKTFATEDKVRELIARTPTRMDQASKQAVEHTFLIGRGGVWLELTAEQYAKTRDNMFSLDRMAYGIG